MKLTVDEDSFLHRYYRFEDRQAGVGLVYCSEESRYFYNVYCVDAVGMKELFSVEFSYLDEALSTLIDEFGQWECVELPEASSGCSSCAAK